MKEFLYKIATKTKQDIKDPKGEVAEQLTKKLSIATDLKVQAGKFYEIKIIAQSAKEADEKIKKISKEILTNPLVETYEIIEFKESN